MMTRKEAIAELKRHKKEFANDHGWNTSVLEAMQMAIEALERMERYNTLPSYEEVMNNMKKMDVDKLQRKFVFSGKDGKENV